MQEQIEIIMASDNNYLSLLVCALCSLFENNKESKSIRVFVIADNISPENLEVLHNLFEMYNRKLILLAPPRLDDKLVVRGRLNESTYYRLMLTELLPADIDKILYLDCDVLIRRSIKSLWSVELDNNLVAGVLDTTGKNARKSIGLKKNENYINAGILLINLKKWREERITLKFLNYLSDQKWNVEFNDQGVINKVCNQRILIINPMYDFMPTYYRYSFNNLKRIVDSNKFYTEQEVNEAKDNPVIIHYAGYAFSRPWFENVNAIYQDEFEYYQKLSGITVIRNKQPNNYKYKMRKFANNCPDRMSIFINKTIDLTYCIFRKIKR